jgi:magnesium chelatase family protein
VIPVATLEELIDILNTDISYTPEPVLDISSLQEEKIGNKYDFSHIVGQSHAKRALEIAAAGGHNIFME